MHELIPSVCDCLLLLLLLAAAQVSLLITMNVLADVLVDDSQLKQQLMKQAGKRGKEAQTSIFVI
jgi:hypothetical protein